MSDQPGEEEEKQKYEPPAVVDEFEMDCEMLIQYYSGHTGQAMVSASLERQFHKAKEAKSDV